MEWTSDRDQYFEGTKPIAVGRYTGSHKNLVVSRFVFQACRQLCLRDILECDLEIRQRLQPRIDAIRNKSPSEADTKTSLSFLLRSHFEPRHHIIQIS
jgi:hypothetical protein